MQIQQTTAEGGDAADVRWWQPAETVRPAWIDANGHMNVAYYVLVFDHATDAVLDRLEIGTAYRQASGCSIFVAEAHITYEQEVREGARLKVASRILSFDGRRLVLFHEMHDAETTALVATNEVLCLHVNLQTRRTTPLPVAARDRIETARVEHGRLPRPSRAGRAISLSARRPA